MGSFSCADVATGLPLGRDEGAVCLVIARRRGGYPDPEKAAASRTIAATDMFEPASLPIRGRVGDYGDFVPSRGQDAVEAACGMAGLRTWKEFEAIAFDFRGEGVPLGKGYLGSPPERRVLGTAYVSAATWTQLVKPYPSQDREADVDAVLSALEVLASLDARSREPGLDVDGVQELRIKVFQNYGLLRLQGSVHVDADDVGHDMPPLARCLDGSEGGSTFCREFAHWMGDASGMMGFDKDRRIVVPSRRLLGEFWDVQQAMTRMRHLNLTLRPSPLASGDAALVGGFACDTVERSLSAVLDRAEEFNDDEGFAKAADLLARIDGMRERIAARVEAGLALGRGVAGP